MSDTDKKVKASAVMEFADLIRCAYESGFIDNHPTNYDIYRSAQVHVKDRYGVETEKWDDDLSKESIADNYESTLQKLTTITKQRDELLSLAYELVDTLKSIGNDCGAEDTAEHIAAILSTIKEQKDAE